MELNKMPKVVYIIASVILAFAMWLFVNGSSDVDLSIEDIPVEFVNAESALANKGLVLISGDDAAVDLVLTMPRSLVYSFDSEHLHLYANLNSINSTGTQSIAYSIAYPPGVNPNQISVKSPTVQTVSVRVGELFRKTDVEIRVNLTGNVADGYVAGRVQVLPATLEVWGQQSDVAQVNYAQVTLNIDNANSTIVEQLEYTLYDYDDKPIHSSSIHAASDTVQVTMPVVSATDVPLVVKFIEEPGVRLADYDYSLDVSSVTLSGDANQIAALGEIVLGEVALSGIEGEQTFVFGIPIPEGLVNLSGATTATLTISNRDVATRSITVTNFSYENFAEGDRLVEVLTSSLNVTLRGSAEMLQALLPQDVTAVADLTDITNASGTYTVPAIIRIEGDPDFGLAENYQLTVRISLPDQEQEPEGETEPEPDPTVGEDQG